jgi:MraZ protein
VSESGNKWYKVEKSGSHMFRGINIINLDGKGRIAIPTRYRSRLKEEVAGRLIATIDTEERCLLLYPLNEWEEIEKKLEKLPSFNKSARRIQRLIMGHASETDMDNSGRILLPDSLRKYASLEKSCVLIGQANKFEIWSEENWDKSREVWLEQTTDSGDLPEELSDLSL